VRVGGAVVNDAVLAFAYVVTIVAALALAFAASCWPRVGRLLFGRFAVASVRRPDR
jgi:hypothetical protein